MMRYSFSDFLNYQNELNDKYDQKVVDTMIDELLIGLKQRIEVVPSTHVLVATTYATIDDGNNYHSYVSECSLKELKAVKEYFEEMGFTVEYLRYYNESPFNDSVCGIRGFALTW